MSTTTPPVSAASKTEAPATAISALTQSLENTSLNTDSKSTPQNTNAQDNNETTENKSDTTSPLMTALTTPVSSDFDVKHPLQFSWTMWYNEPQPRNSKEWTNNVKKILTFDTVEDFWCLFNNLYAPSRLVPGSNYHLFKEGIKPEWEDPANKKGGKWICAFSRPHGNAMANKAFDDAWLWTILALIGEQFTYSDDISGLVISPRANKGRMALWTKSADNEDVTLKVGHDFRAHMKTKTSMSYMPHYSEGKGKDGKSKDRNKYTL